MGAPWLSAFDRSTLAKAVMDGLKEFGADSDDVHSFELMWKSRALSLMQSRCPSLGAYDLGLVTTVSKDQVGWDDLKFTGSEDDPAQFLPEGSAKYRLLLSKDYLDIVPEGSKDGDTIRIPINLGLESKYLGGWATTSDAVAVCIVDFTLTVGVAMQTPSGVSEAIG